MSSLTTCPDLKEKVARKHLCMLRNGLMYCLEKPFGDDRLRQPSKNRATHAPEPEAMNTSPQINLPAPHDTVDATHPSTLQCSEAEPAVTIGTSLALDQALHQAERHCNSGHPTVAYLCAHGHRVGIGLGLADSFVSIQCYEPTPGPRLITLGGTHPAKPGAVFFFLGGRRAEIPRRNLLPAVKAREVFREFFATGARSTSVNWQAL
jgi:hypothetical protein